jgi:hypothetical protein
VKKISACLLSFCLLWMGAPAAAKVYVAEPMLVPQPAFAGMNFYVYRPYNFPKGWYLTFDGYPVIQTKDKLWVYGMLQANQLLPTGYLVGSVNPSLAGLTPYPDSAVISSTVDLGQARVLASQPPLPALSVPPDRFRAAYMPDWALNARFTAIGTWRHMVDRMGVLHKPNVPIAWKGENPSVILIWTGASWYRAEARANDRPADVLRRELYSLQRMVNHNRFQWYAQDTPVLTEHAIQWGYYWMGEVVPSR